MKLYHRNKMEIQCPKNSTVLRMVTHNMFFLRAAEHEVKMHKLHSFGYLSGCQVPKLPEYTNCSSSAASYHPNGSICKFSTGHELLKLQCETTLLHVCVSVRYMLSLSLRFCLCDGMEGERQATKPTCLPWTSASPCLFQSLPS